MSIRKGAAFDIDMTKSTLTTKTVPSNRKGRHRSGPPLKRPRLVKELEQSLAFPVTWICGPAGCGKTTLVDHYVITARFDAIRVKLRKSDADVAPFFKRLARAINENHPEIESLPALPSPRKEPVRTFIQHLFTFLADRIAQPQALVIDNYQHIAANSPLHAIVSEMVHADQTKLHLVVISRTAPPPVLARLLANRRIYKIGWDQLRFNLQETRRLARMLAGMPPTAPAVNNLFELTDGWVAGLVMLLGQPQNHGRRPPIKGIDALHQERIFRYFEEQVLARLSHEHIDFLLITSVFPIMNAPMAAYLSADPRAESYLTFFARENLFTYRVLGRQILYHYHPLFRKFLLDRLKKKYSGESFGKLQQHAAKLLELNDQTEAALTLYFSFADWPNAVNLILNRARRQMLQGRHKTLQRWIGHLPTKIQNNDPWLIFWLAQCRMPEQPAQCTTLFTSALAKFEHRNDDKGIAFALGGVIESILFLHDRFDALDQWLPRLEKLVSRLNGQSQMEVEAQACLCMLYVLPTRYPDQSDYQQWRERAEAFLLKQIAPDLKVRLLQAIVFSHNAKGFLAEADLLLRTHRQIVQKPESEPLEVILLKTRRAHLAWLNGRFDQGLDIIAEARALADTSGVTLFDHLFTVHHIAALLSMGRPRPAEELMDEVQPHLQAGGAYLQTFYYMLKAWQAMLADDGQAAVKCAARALEKAGQSGARILATDARLCMGLAHKLAGDYRQAAKELDAALSSARKANMLLAEFTIHLARAETALAQNDRPVVYDALREAMKIGKVNEYINTWFWRPGVMTRLCLIAIENHIEEDYVKYLIHSRGLYSPIVPIDFVAWPWPYKIFALGKFEIRIHEEPLVFTGKVRQKPMELLKAIITLGGRQVSKERIIRLLWPEAKPEACANLLDTNVHRLRRMIRQKEVIVIANSAISLDVHLCWVDSLAFNELLNEAEEALQNESAMSQSFEDRMQGVLKMAQGRYMPDDEYAWVIALRTKQMDQLNRLIRELGAAYSKADRISAAMRTYTIGLQNDPCQETFYLGLMRAYSRMGRQSEVLSLYHRYIRNVVEELGQQPSEAIEKLYHAVPKRSYLRPRSLT